MISSPRVFTPNRVSASKLFQLRASISEFNGLHTSVGDRKHPSMQKGFWLSFVRAVIRGLRRIVEWGLEGRSDWGGGRQCHSQSGKYTNVSTTGWQGAEQTGVETERQISRRGRWWRDISKTIYARKNSIKDKKISFSRGFWSYAPAFNHKIGNAAHSGVSEVVCFTKSYKWTTVDEMGN